MPGAVIYCRVSTKEQTQNLSLSTQERQCRNYCEQHGLTIDRVFIEQGESAKTANRPEFQKLLVHCRTNKSKIHFVVVYSLSRFSRHTVDHHAIRAVLSGLGVSLRSVTEPIDDSSTGKFVESMIAAVAQLDNDVRSERTIEGMKAAVGQGRWPFPAPLGYRMVSTNTASRMEPDPASASHVKTAFELYASGNYEREEVLRKVTGQGLRTRRGKKVSSQTFSRLLSNPIYAGRILVPRWGIDCLGSFVPIVSDEIFQRVQDLLAGRKTVTGPDHKQHPDFPLRHFVRCLQCDKPLTASWSTGRSSKYPYYRCARATCKSVNSTKQQLELRFVELLQQLQPRPEYLRLFKAVVLDVWKEHQAEATRASATLRKRSELLAQRKNRLVDAYLHEGKIDHDVYQDQLARLREEQTLAEMELNEARVDELDIETVVNFATNAIGDASRFWIEASVEQKQRFQSVLFPKGLTFDGERFGTAPTCFAFSYLREVSLPNSSLASRTGVEPVSPP